jgi:hypothetical protein
MMNGGYAGLFAQVLERDLDAVIVKLLIVRTELIAAIGPAMKELAHHANRSVRLPFQLGRAADVDRAIEIDVVDVVIKLAHQQARDGFVANAQYLRSGSDGRDVLVTPPDLVIQTQASNGGAVGIQVHPFGTRQVVSQVLRERHFCPGNQIDDHPHLLSLGSLRRSHRRADQKEACKDEVLDCVGHDQSLSPGVSDIRVAIVALTLGERWPNWSATRKFPSARDLRTPVSRNHHRFEVPIYCGRNSSAITGVML